MLNNFDLVNTNGLEGLNFQGDFIPLTKIDDALAAQLEGKTHVLRRKPTPGVERVVAQLGDGAEAEPAATGRKRASN